MTRYPGSRILQVDEADFNEYQLPTAVETRRPAKARTLQGKVTKLYYQNPAGRSTLEIYSNYTQALKSAGFREVFTCEDLACGNGALWNSLNGIRVSGTGDKIRYFSGVREQGGAPTHVAVMVSAGATSLHVIEGRPMETGLVTVSAEAMAEGIDREGHINLYGIYFDTGRSDLKPESTPALEQIAQLLASRPTLKVHVVGHTDNTGALPANMKLSADRATSVIAALTAKHAVAPGRLMAHGVGPVAPVASNSSAEGKAKNRRVDLVAQ